MTCSGQHLLRLNLSNRQAPDQAGLLSQEGSSSFPGALNFHRVSFPFSLKNFPGQFLERRSASDQFSFASVYLKMFLVTSGLEDAPWQRIPGEELCFLPAPQQVLLSRPPRSLSEVSGHSYWGGGAPLTWLPFLYPLFSVVLP